VVDSVGVVGVVDWPAQQSKVRTTASAELPQRHRCSFHIKCHKLQLVMCDAEALCTKGMYAASMWGPYDDCYIHIQLLSCSAAEAGLTRLHGESPGLQDEDAEEAADAAPPAEEAAADDALEPPALGNDELAG
jgi:hypothetical protein